MLDAETLGLIAASATIVSAFVRLVVSARAPRLDGVSAGFPWLLFVSNVGWVSYGIRADVPQQIWPSLLWGLIAVYLIARVHREGRPQWRNSAFGTVGSLFMIVASILMPASSGLAAGMLGVASTVPQSVRLWRTRNIAGVGPVAWMFSLLLAAAWTVFGLAAGLVPIWLTNGLYILLCITILAGYARARLSQHK